MSGELAGRRALVTGAASGIGLACVQELARAGAEVMLLDCDAESVERAAAEVAGTPIVCDLADLDAVDTLSATVDIVVNNAGLQHVAPIDQFPADQFGLLLRIMLEAPFRILRATLPGMYERGWGRVVNISSIHGRRASAYKSAYVAAKHGLEGLSKVVALEGAEHGVTSNCVSPAYVRTPLVDGQIEAQVRLHGRSSQEVIDTIMLQKTAIKRLIEPDEVAALVLFLCRPEAASITGSSFAIDGGWTAR